MPVYEGGFSFRPSGSPEYDNSSYHRVPLLTASSAAVRAREQLDEAWEVFRQHEQQIESDLLLAALLFDVPGFDLIRLSPEAWDDDTMEKFIEAQALVNSTDEENAITSALRELSKHLKNPAVKSLKKAAKKINKAIKKVNHIEHTDLTLDLLRAQKNSVLVYSYAPEETSQNEEEKKRKKWLQEAHKLDITSENIHQKYGEALLSQLGRKSAEQIDQEFNDIADALQYYDRGPEFNWPQNYASSYQPLEDTTYSHPDDNL